MSNVTSRQIEIFRSGSHRSAEGAELAFSAGDIAAMAAGYDKALHEAPIVVGHPKDDAPAYGWVSGLQATEDGRLVADVDQVDAAFAELVGAGRFKKISASFYAPGSKDNPKPETYYLRHVGFLGAQPPAVKGLKAVAFSDAGEELVTVEFGEISPRSVASLFRGLRDFLIGEFGQEKADAALPGYEVQWLEEQAVRDDGARLQSFREAPQQTSEEEKTMEDPAQVDALKAETERKTAEVAEREQALASREAAFAEAEALKGAETFIAAQVAAGRVLPAEQAGLVDFMSRLDDAATVSFAEGDGAKDATMRKHFEVFVSGLPKRVEFSEIAAGGGDELDLTDPRAIADAAVSFQEEQKAKGIVISADAAVRHVTKKGS